MTGAADFHVEYAAALRAHLEAQDEDTLAVGHELGRRALQEQISILAIVENHSRLVDAPDSGIDAMVGLQFLLQTLAALDVVTRGFLDGTKRYELQRARAEDLADRDEFRTALVNSLQEGFFVADGTGAVIEINDAFADITGYGADGVPYGWPHPWMAGRYLYDQIFTNLTARPAGELSEFNGGPPIVCSTWLMSGVTLVVMRMFSGDPVTTLLLRLVNSLPS